MPGNGAAIRRRELRVAATPEDLFDSDGDVARVRQRARRRRRTGALHVTPLEYRLLTLLATERGRVLAHAWLVDHLWRPTTTATARTVHALVSRLRRTIEPRPALPRYIITVAKCGYRCAHDSPEP